MISIKKNLKNLAKLAFYFIPIIFLLTISSPVLTYFHVNSPFFSSVLWMQSATIFMLVLLFCGILFSALAERLKK
ncbi:hypothetical protein D8X97_05710 [Listeria ivanovii]|nr:conserved hypothetical protein [Listeria ivanovii FSL F6-596]MBM5607758.1 hypothetical protein [Listeria ivanovii]MBM5636227.1 hypothetical protein [Listeria ivanovii]MBM5705410.1 hypothetical protein [Listeria ivanovii]